MVDWETLFGLIAYAILVGFILAIAIFLLTSFQAVGIGYLFGLFLGAVFALSTYQLYLSFRETPESGGSNGDQSRTEKQTQGTDHEKTTGIERSRSRLVSAGQTLGLSLVGVIISAAVAGFEWSFPALALGIGAVGIVLLLLFVDGRTYYAGAGALFCLSSAAAIYLGYFPEAYSESPFAVLVTLGAVSGLIVAVHLGIGIVLQRSLAGVTGEKTALRIYDAVAAILGLLGLIWTVITFEEKAARYGGVTIGGTAGFVLNFLGIELPIPWIISSGVDATLVIYIGGILIGFHTLESIHTTWRATKATTSAGVAAGKQASHKASAATSEVRNKAGNEP
jgi:hypothetical protein